jgi:hypothetical protein
MENQCTGNWGYTSSRSSYPLELFTLIMGSILHYPQAAKGHPVNTVYSIYVLNRNAMLPSPYILLAVVNLVLSMATWLAMFHFAANFYVDMIGYPIFLVLYIMLCHL